mgnify:CR=1 FL=1
MAKAQNAKAKKKGGNANRRNIWLLVLTTVLVLGSIFMFTPPQDKINQGLDIQGGLSVVLSAKSTDGDAVTLMTWRSRAPSSSSASTRSVPPRPWCSCRAPIRSSCRSPVFPTRKRRCPPSAKPASWSSRAWIRSPMRTSRPRSRTGSTAPIAPSPTTSATSCLRARPST